MEYDVSIPAVVMQQLHQHMDLDELGNFLASCGLKFACIINPHDDPILDVTHLGYTIINMKKFQRARLKHGF